MTFEFSLWAEERILPAYEWRIALSRARGFPDDDPALPKRIVEVIEESVTRWFIVGPVEPGGKDERLIEVSLGIG